MLVSWGRLGLGCGSTAQLRLELRNIVALTGIERANSQFSSIELNRTDCTCLQLARLGLHQSLHTFPKLSLAAEQSSKTRTISHWRILEEVERPITVVEVEPFPAKAAEVWNDEERLEFISFIAYNPDSGDPIPGSRGVRKVRWSRSGTGKRGGVRVI